MRAARLIAGSVLTVGVLSLAGPVAFAADGGGTASNVTPFAFKIYPTTVKAGGNIGLGVSGCDATSATASSGVFDTVTLPSTGTKGEYVGAATVDADAKPGAQYDVKFTCGSSSGTTTLTVAGGSATTSPATAVPTGAVKTGLGGGNGSMSPAELAGGGALAVLALGGLGLAVRRRSGNHS
ncbi:hypothetical protein ACEZDB_15460 [Streptacidiphilus sp. N1-3]|uniref:Gram-positive cocci surface proteins LPxTG domain-containing protein n=1 Tax=Streptacidiphilus alkalitolerans TaxID=3342712 RepID=A0ABV6X218_9ACTN